VGGEEEETRVDRPSKREHCYLSRPIQGMMQYEGCHVIRVGRWCYFFRRSGSRC
jgi:hypothetical protein